MKLLSIIVPFFNAEKKSERLLRTIEMIEDNDVEFIFVDDGSTDNTLKILETFKHSTNQNIFIISQSNKGPGGARNIGLKSAQGKYIWFVDCDDDINPEAITILREVHPKNYEFIDFDVYPERGHAKALPVTEGAYMEPKFVRKFLIEHMGHLVNKCVKKEILIKNRLFYPEYCIYEDNPHTLLLPFFFTNFYKSKCVAYYQYKHDDSVTHSGVNLRYFDRLWTMEWGIKRACPLIKNEHEKMYILKKFTRIHLINTIGPFIGRAPKPSWLVAMKVMQRHRKILKKNKCEIKLLQFWSFPILYKIKFYILWILSYVLCVFCDEEKYFKNVYQKAWKREFDFDI